MTSATCMQVPIANAEAVSRAAEAGATTASDPCVASAGIVGGSGYTGALLAELLLKHPSVKLAAISSETLAGEPVQQHLPRLRSGLSFCRQADLGGVDIAFLCTPHGDAAPIARQLLDDGVKVIDLSADFRLDAATYAEWYGEHPHPELLPGVYGLTELHRDAVAGADLVANPGCYPTAALLALAPLEQLGLADVIIDAKSGVSGAGKTPQEATHFCSVDSDLVAYGIQSHRHYPEIAAGLAGAATGLASSGASPVPFGAAAVLAAHAPSLTFVPHLVPLQRGISETIYVRPGTLPLPGADRVTELFREFYDGETFVEVCDAPPRLKDVAGTNYCRIHPHVDRRAGRIVVFSVIDNLMKGASGQAVQNMNVMLGLPEHEGLV
jgi:N-acetyl-gamma-glutamyl-phosphate reductase